MMRPWVWVVLAACGTDVAPTTTALFAMPGEPADDFYALPFPNDLRRQADGTIDLSELPTNSLIVDDYREAADSLDGFGKNSAIFARFDGRIDTASLPDPTESMAAAASVYLVDVDRASPARGERTPIIAKFRTEGTDTLGANNLVVRPYPGFTLADGRTYALVITDRVAASGASVVRSPAFDALMANGDAAYAPLLDWLDETGGDERDDVVSAAVFTTQHATSIVPAIRRAIFAAPVPLARSITTIVTAPGFKAFAGTYMAPNFQRGSVPYRNAPDGAIEAGPDGAAIIQRMEPMRFAITIPIGTMPRDGWPTAIYSHGTGGDYRSFIDDGTAAALAAQGIATISTDQVLHGPRNPGGNPELDFFNVANPYAMRDNTLQGVADAFSQLRLLERLSIPDGAKRHKADRTKIYFFGHSQGGLTGPGFVAFEPSLTGAVFSGTGALLYLAMLYKTKPLDVPMLLQTFLRDDPVDEENPSLALFQMWAERADTASYAPLMVREPREGIAPRNIFQTEGFDDSYTPNPAIEAFAVGLGADLVKTPDEREVPGLALRGRMVLAPPFEHNAGDVTCALAQYEQADSSDGHFVVFDIPSATKQASEFLGTLARTGTATVVAP